VDELKDKPGKLYPLQCDLSLPNEIESTSEWIEKNLGSVDILVNSASISLDWSSINGGIQELKKTIDINLLGLSLLTKKILQLMKNKGRYQGKLEKIISISLINKKILEIDNGWIINVNDVCGLKLLPLASDRPLSPAYAASKSALTALSECLRLELAQNESNIKVTVSNFETVL